MSRNRRNCQVVVVPRKIAPQWWDKPWDDVVAAASVDDNGMRVSEEREFSSIAPKGMALLREEDGRAFLLSQGW